MYKYITPSKTTLKKNTSYEGERLELKLKRMLTNKEPMSDSVPLIYSERKDGVLPEYNPRTDRWEIAVDATDKIQQTYAARREENANKFKNKLQEENNKIQNPQQTQGGSQSTEGTANK